MIEHPWLELQFLIKEKWLTQKAFAIILWKKVSEVNELLKWKRNITIQRDYLLHQTLWTPIKYRILKQVDYEYSLLNIEESSNPPFLTEKDNGKNSQHYDIVLDDNKKSTPSINKLNEMNQKNPEQIQETTVEIQNSKDNEDIKNRARIFRTF